MNAYIITSSSNVGLVILTAPLVYATNESIHNTSESEAHVPTNITNKSEFESGYQHGVKDPDFKPNDAWKRVWVPHARFH